MLQSLVTFYLYFDMFPWGQNAHRFPDTLLLLFRDCLSRVWNVLYSTVLLLYYYDILWEWIFCLERAQYSP